MNVSAFRNNQPTRRRCVAHPQRCRHFHRAKPCDRLIVLHRSTVRNVQFQGVLRRVSFGLWPGALVESWSKIARVEINTVLGGCPRISVYFVLPCAPLTIYEQFQSNANAASVPGTEAATSRDAFVFSS